MTAGKIFCGAGKGLRFFALLAAPLLLTACASIFVSQFTAIEEFTGDDDSIKLVLEPLDIWDGEGAGALEEFTINGSTTELRLRADSLFDQAWLRAGLFWDSRRKDGVIMPLVIASGPPVTFLKVRVDTDNRRYFLDAAENFTFVPGKRPFDKELYHGAFALDTKILADIVSSKDIHITVQTSRGGLTANLAVVSDDDSSTLATNAKYQFAEFHRRLQARR